MNELTSPTFTYLFNSSFGMYVFLDFVTLTAALIVPIFHPALQPASHALVLCAISWLC